MGGESLEQPLIRGPQQDPTSIDQSRSATWRHEAKVQVALALPVMGMMAVQLLLILMSAAFVGHLGAFQLATAQLATTLAYATGHNLLMGMALGLETIGGQLVGAGHFDELGHVTYLSLFVFTLLAAVISIAWAFTEPLLLSLRQDPALAASAARYMLLLIPSLFANAWTQPLIKFLQSQSKSGPLARASIFALALHVPSNWFFIYHLGWGLTGAPVATSLACCLIFLLLLGHILTSGAYSHSLPPPNSARSLRQAPRFLKLGFFSASMMCLQYAAFDVIYLLAGLLPNPYQLVSALSVALNTTWLCAASYNGLGNAVSTRVAIELGQGSILGARRAAHVGLLLALFIGGVATSLILVARSWWPLLFIDGSDRELLFMCAILMLLTSLFVFGDAIQAVAGGVIRGCGRQRLGALVTLSSFYIIGIPAAAIGGFVVRLGIWGIFGGTCLGTFNQLIVFMIIVANTDWTHQATRLQKLERLDP